MEQNVVGCLLNVPDGPSFWLLGLPRWTWEAADENWALTLQSPYLICCGFLRVTLWLWQVSPRSGSGLILMLYSCILNFELKYTVWKIFNKKIEKNHKKEKKRKVLNAIYDGVIFHSTHWNHTVSFVCLGRWACLLRHFWSYLFGLLPYINHSWYKLQLWA